MEALPARARRCRRPARHMQRRRSPAPKVHFREFPAMFVARRCLRTEHYYRSDRSMDKITGDELASTGILSTMSRPIPAREPCRRSIPATRGACQPLDHRSVAPDQSHADRASVRWAPAG
jgi:hypothetical protein